MLLISLSFLLPVKNYVIIIHGMSLEIPRIKETFNGFMPLIISADAPIALQLVTL
jgi:hypothetical protein